MTREKGKRNFGKPALVMAGPKAVRARSACAIKPLAAGAKVRT